ncbi:MAG: hypothetical protein Q9218_003240 [Villophora microphyllina]
MYIVRQITFYGDGPATAKINLHGTVFLNFVPTTITWKDTGRVVDAFETIVAKDNWTFATHITIEEAGVGTVGTLSLTYRAPGTVSDSLLSIDESPLEPPASSNSTLAASAQQPNGNATVRPTSPHSQDIPGSHINILCAGYGSILDDTASFGVLGAAALFVSGKVKDRGPLALADQNIKPFRVLGVEFELYPSDRLRWYDLLMALDGVVDFVEQYGPSQILWRNGWLTQESQHDSFAEHSQSDSESLWRSPPQDQET